MNISPELDLNLTDILGNHIALLGTTGQGKSTTAKVLIEELLKADASIPICIIDRHNEYWPLAAIGNFLRVGLLSQGADLECDIEHVEALARFSVEQNVSIILSLKHMMQSEARTYAARFLNALWTAISLREEPRPYVLFIEEAQVYAPQDGKSEAKDVLVEIAMMGRRMGVTMVVATQRASKIEKDVISQATTRFFHKAAFANDVSVYVDNTPEWTAAEVKKANASLAKGQAIVTINNERVQIAQMRRSSVYDAGATPGVDQVEKPKLRPVNRSLIKELRALLTEKAAPPAPDAEKQRLLAENADLTAQKTELADALEQARAQIGELRSQVEMLSLIKVSGGATIPADDLHVQNIHTAQIVTGGAVQAELPKTRDNGIAIASEVEQRISEQAAQREATLMSRTLKQEQRRFDALLNDIWQHTSRAWLDAYTYLLIKEGEKLSLKQINSRLARSIDRPPKVLIDERLVKREGRGPRAAYWSDTREALRKRFPNLDADVLYERILSMVSPKGKS